MPANMKKAGMNYMYGGSKKKMGYGGSKKHNLVMEEGGSLKPIPSDNKGLPNLPKAVRNNMGYMKHGGMKKMMGVPGMYQEGGNLDQRMSPEDKMAMMEKAEAEQAMNTTPTFAPKGIGDTLQGSRQASTETFPFEEKTYNTRTIDPNAPAVPPVSPNPESIDQKTSPNISNEKMVGIPGMYSGGSMTTDSAKNMMGMRKKGGKFPDLTGDGKVTRADILKGRGVI
jgi:hypothetical protein